MQIKRLKIIKRQLCLNDFEIKFETGERCSSTIVIGENGTGKTTLLETVLEILMSFDSPAIRNQLDYDYEFEYEHAQSQFSISKTGRDYCIKKDDQEYYGRFTSVRKQINFKRIFPQRVIAFYSGANNRIEWMINRQNRRYRSDCRYIIGRYIESLKDTTIELSHFPKRKFNYCDESMTPIYLAAILLGHDSFGKKYLNKQCNLSTVESIYVTLNLDKVERLFGGSRQDVKSLTNLSIISEFIEGDKRFTNLLRHGFFEASWGKGRFDLKDLEIVEMDSISILEYFEKMHSLFDAQFDVTVLFNNTPVKVSNMSEGQRQLIKILGMLDICKSEDCLVLMDEPDAHMNPRWKYEIKKTIDSCLEESTNTQAIIATHDPLVINGVDKNQIRIFELDKEGNTNVIEPTENTEGLGIDGLLQSEYYGLRTSYDKKTSDLYEKQRLLFSKLINEQTTEDEEKELCDITKKLSSLPVMNSSIDFLYDDFFREYRKSNYYNEEYLSPEEVSNKNKKITTIINKLFAK